MGTDWPVVVEEAVGSRLEATLTAVGLSAQEQRMIGGANALRLLGIE
jgi:predicted TIM-barrel fold metal-dependent hydrolase